MNLLTSLNSRLQRPIRGNSLVVLLCLMCLLVIPQITIASPAETINSQGWSLVPGVRTADSFGTPDYTVRPATINPLRIQSNIAPAPVRLQTDSQHPLFFELNNQQFGLGAGLHTKGQLDLTSVVGWQPLDQLVVALGLQTSIFEQAQHSADFQAISSIQCESASVEPGLYHVSNCHFINSGQALNQPINNFSSLGATWAPTESASLQLEYFRQNTTALTNSLSTNASLPGLLTSGHNPLTDNRALLPSAYLGGNTRLDGFGINLALGYEHDQMGKLRLGLQLARINNAEYTDGLNNYGFSNNNQSTQALTALSPFHTATVNIDWNRGSFSGGVQGYYREPLTLYNQKAAEDLSGFDIYFSWRAPWNANLSIGTSSVIEPAITSHAAEEGGSDPFELIYGRVPYVRYQQDL